MDYSKLVGRHFIDTQEWSMEELWHLLDLAMDLKRRHHQREVLSPLQNQTLFMMFFEQSTRTRNSFTAGMTQLGGNAVDLTPDKMQISHGETPMDTGKVLSRYGHGIAIRNCNWGEGNAYIREVAKNSSVPVFNMQCDHFHPCQALADAQTIVENFGKRLSGRKFVISWAYAPSYTKPMSVPVSCILMMSRMGLDVTLAHPPEFRLMDRFVTQAEQNAKEAGSRFEVVHDMDAAFEGAHVLYPKSWGCMLETTDKAESMKISQKYKNWICDERRMGLASKEAIYMHCLPADRGSEVTDAVIDGPQSVVFDEAENRMHAQKALMLMSMGGLTPDGRIRSSK